MATDEIRSIDKELRRSKSELLRPLALLLVYSGLRRGEALQLKWTDLDLAAGFFHVRKAKRGKTRTIPLTYIRSDILSVATRFELAGV